MTVNPTHRQTKNPPLIPHMNHQKSHRNNHTACAKLVPVQQGETNHFACGIKPEDRSPNGSHGNTDDAGRPDAWPTALRHTRNGDDDDGGGGASIGTGTVWFRDGAAPAVDGAGGGGEGYGYRGRSRNIWPRGGEVLIATGFGTRSRRMVGKHGECDGGGLVFLAMGRSTAVLRPINTVIGESNFLVIRIYVLAISV